MLSDVTRESEYDQRPQACSVHCKLKFSIFSIFIKEEAQPDNPFSFVLSRGGAQAPQAPVIAGKAEAWKTPDDGIYTNKVKLVANQEESERLALSGPMSWQPRERQL